MKIYIIHPSRSRPVQAYATYCNWMKKADNPANIHYLLSIDTDQKAVYQKQFGSTFHYVVAGNHSAITAINIASKFVEIAVAEENHLFIVVSDDFDCPEHWDTLLLAELAGKSDFIVKTQDGLQPTLITLPIMDRIYYNRFGYIYHPEFLHLHADEEMTIVALMLGRYIKSDLMFEHCHYTTGKFKKDAISVRNDKTWAHGQTTLNRHAKNNFGIANPLIRREDIKWR